MIEGGDEGNREGSFEQRGIIKKGVGAGFGGKKRADGDSNRLGGAN